MWHLTDPTTARAVRMAAAALSVPAAGMLTSLSVLVAQAADSPAGTTVGQWGTASGSALLAAAWVWCVREFAAGRIVPRSTVEQARLLEEAHEREEEYARALGAYEALVREMLSTWTPPPRTRGTRSSSPS